jgi:hypothetical protein
MGTPHIGMGRDMSIFQIGESPYQYGAHSNLGTNMMYVLCVEQQGKIRREANTAQNMNRMLLPEKSDKIK